MYSLPQVCRRTFGSKDGLHRIPENEVLDFRSIVCFPQMELVPSSKARVAPPGTKVKTTEVPAAPTEEIRKRRAGFWKVFKLKPKSGKRKSHNHHVDASSLLSFVWLLFPELGTAKLRIFFLVSMAPINWIPDPDMALTLLHPESNYFIISFAPKTKWCKKLI